MDYNASKTRSWYHLLPVLLGIMLIVQAGSAIDCTLDLSTPYNNIFLGSTVTISAHVYDPGYPHVRVPDARVAGTVYSDTGEHADLTTFTNASGWSVISYKPPSPGRYVYTFAALVNYSTIPGLPAAGMQSASAPGIVVNVTTRHIPVTPLITLAPLATTTTTPVPPVTTPRTAQQTTPVTQVTQATPVPQAASPVPASQSDTTPPVTTLTLAGPEDGSGGYSAGVTCTLTAADNAGGSGVSVTQYSFDGTSWNPYTGPVTVTNNGVTTLYYRSSDNAGNTEVAKVKAVVISGPGTAPAGAALQNPGTTGPSASPSSDVPFYPLPIWLVALIIFILLAAIGGSLYLKSQLKKEEPKQ